MDENDEIYRLPALSIGALRKILGRHAFLLTASALLLLCMLAFRAPVASFFALLVCFVLPGYLFLASFFDLSETQAFALSFPTGYFLTMVPSYMGTLFGLPTVSIALPLAVALILAGYWHYAGRKAPGQSTPAEVAINFVLFAAAFALAAQMITELDFSTARPYYASSYDYNEQLLQADYMARTGTNNLVPLLSQGNAEGLENQYFAPLSIIPAAILQSASAMKAWNASSLLFCAVFAFAILGVFLVFSSAFGNRAAFFGAALSAVPARYLYLHAAMLGQNAVLVTVLALLAALFACARLLGRSRGSGWLLGMYAALLGLVFPAGTALLAVPAAFAFLQKDRGRPRTKKAGMAAAAILVLAAVAFQAAMFSQVRPAEPRGADSELGIIARNPGLTELESRYLLQGAIPTFRDVPALAWALFCVGGLFALFAGTSQKKLEGRLLALAAMAGIIFVSGIFAVPGHGIAALQMRIPVFLALAVPLAGAGAAFALDWVLDAGNLRGMFSAILPEKPQLPAGISKTAVSIAALAALTALLAAHPSSYSRADRVPEEFFSLLDHVASASDANARILYLGTDQALGCLNGLRCYEVGPGNMMFRMYSGNTSLQFAVSRPCLPGLKRTSPVSAILVGCKNSSQLEDASGFDMVVMAVAGGLAPLDPEYYFWFTGTLVAERGFEVLPPEGVILAKAKS